MNLCLTASIYSFLLLEVNGIYTCKISKILFLAKEPRHKGTCYDSIYVTPRNKQGQNQKVATTETSSKRRLRGKRLLRESFLECGNIFYLEGTVVIWVHKIGKVYRNEHITVVLFIGHHCT